MIDIDGQEAFIVNPQNTQERSPLEPWLGMVLSLADGQHTLKELVENLSRRYPNGPPEELERTIESVVERLLDSEVMKLDEKPVQLPYYLALPLNEQDPDTGRKSLLESGLITH